MIAVKHETPYLSPEAYLERERAADDKSEYLWGEMYAMAGSSPEHSIITVNLTGTMFALLKGRTCQAFSNDMKVRTDPRGLYAYPDLSVVCGEPRFHDEKRDVLTNPTVIIEVLSPSTEAFDRGRKFAQYQTIDSLSDYLLVAQDEPQVDHYARQPDNRWLLTPARGIEARVALVSIDCRLALAEIYDRLAFGGAAATGTPS